jgi:chromosome segregation protein
VSCHRWEKTAKAIALQRTVDSHFTTIEPPPSDPEPAILAAAHDEYRTLLADAKAALVALIRQGESITGSPDTLDPESPWRRWQEILRAFKTAYDAAVQRSSAHSETMKQLQAIEQQLGDHRRETSRVREELRGLDTAEATYRAGREVWETLIRERDDLLETQCQSLTTASAGAIRAQVRRYADASDFTNILRQSLSGSRIREVNSTLWPRQL